MKVVLRTPHFIRKAILSSDPSNRRDCVVVATTAFDRLMYCRPGDEQWASIDGQYDVYEYITFFIGRLCGVNNVERVVSCSFQPKPQSEYMEVPLLRQTGEEWCQWYLVESCGRLLFVLRYVGDHGLCDTIGFEVYKLEMGGPGWVEVRNLADQMLFLGVSHSETYSAKQFSGSGFKGNCIYFTGQSVRVDMYKFVELMGAYELQDIGVFSLGDGSISTACSFNPEESAHSPIWVKPNPW